MKKIGMIIYVGLVSIIAFGQNFETNLTISPLMSFKSNKTTESKVAFGFLGTIQEFYNLNNNFGIGTELIYSYENYKLIRNLDVISISEPASSNYDIKLTVSSFKIPLVLRFKTKSNWSFNIDYGVSYIINNKASVDYVYTNLFNNKKTTTEIPEKSVISENNLSRYYSVGIGKSFKFKNIRYFVEIYYIKSYAKYRIEHIGVNREQILYFYNVSPRYAGIKFGFGL